ncbi:MAG: hypothetical protein ACRC0L_00850, partial [Angustibacter sp.]
MDLPTPAPQPADAKNRRGLVLTMTGIATAVIIALILALVLVNRPGSADGPTSSGQNAAKVKVDPGASRCALP